MVQNLFVCKPHAFEDFEIVQVGHSFDLQCTESVQTCTVIQLNSNNTVINYCAQTTSQLLVIADFNVGNIVRVWNGAFIALFHVETYLYSVRKGAVH